MKSFFIWLIATVLGAVLGLGLSLLTGMNLYLCVGIGMVLGNSAGVTANIYRGRETTAFDSETQDEVPESPSKTNQKAS